MVYIFVFFSFCFSQKVRINYPPVAVWSGTERPVVKVGRLMFSARSSARRDRERGHKSAKMPPRLIDLIGQAANIRQKHSHGRKTEALGNFCCCVCFVCFFFIFLISGFHLTSLSLINRTRHWLRFLFFVVLGMSCYRFQLRIVPFIYPINGWDSVAQSTYFFF